MEVEVQLGQRVPAVALSAFMVIVGLVGLGMLGRSLAPDRVLTWSEWQLLLEQRAYAREHKSLKNQAMTLAAFVDRGQRDAVQGQWLAEQTERLLSRQKVAALEPQRAALWEAANAVRAWSLGQIDTPTVRQAIERALDALE